ncbi:MAG: hypothetical protein IE926_05740 [Micrococcales bacterium]|nr:hypothetical protein [Micrococcales bacterium]
MSNAWNITYADVTPEDWPDAEAIGETAVQVRLDAAQRQCEAYAPVLDAPVAPATFPGALPAGYLLAVIYQARDVHNASQLVGDAAAVGDVPYAVRVKPLSGAVRALLRPPRGRLTVG